MRRLPGARLVRSLRAFAALVALVLVGAQLTSIGHHVLVAHYLCAKHGTLHHGQAPELRSTERMSAETATPEENGDHGSHDDCYFPARTPAELAEIARWTLVATAPESSAALLAPDAALPHDAIPLLALAPKLSPPRA